MRWDEFAQEPLYNRSQLPQVNQGHLDQLDIPYHRTMVNVSDLQPGQTHDDLQPSKIRRCIKNIQSGQVKPLVVDRDLRIVNGHHRYAAAQQLGMDTMTVFQVDLPLEGIAQLARSVAPVHESS